MDFNMKTLNYYRNCDDDMKKDLAQNCVDDFTNYGGIVLYFDKKMENWRKNLDAEQFKQKVGHMDRTRKMIHDNCIHDITIMNRMAHNDHIKPFATWENGGNDISRTDIGKAIIEQCYEQMKGLDPKAQPGKTQAPNKLKSQRDIINNYNYMLGATKYPVIKDEKTHDLKFVDMFTLKQVPYATVKNYTEGRTDDPNKLKMMEAANNLIEQQSQNQKQHGPNQESLKQNKPEDDGPEL